MTVCGISIASSEAVLVWIDGGGKLIGAAKVSLADPYEKGDLSRVSELLRQLLVEKNTDLVVVRKSSVGGKFGAGHMAYRLETIIALGATCDVEFISPQSAASFYKKVQPELPAQLKKYQNDAYIVAVMKT